MVRKRKPRAFVIQNIYWDPLRGIELVLPILVVSEPNLRGSRRSKIARTKAQRMAAWAAVHNLVSRTDRGNVTSVTLMRYGVRLLDDDNLAGAFKAVRDGIADALGVNDGKIPWHYDQQTSLLRGIKISLHLPSMSTTSLIPSIFEGSP